MHLSVVSPVYLGEVLVKELALRLTDAIPRISSEFEIILVDDGSPDNSWKVIEMLCAENEKIKGIQLSRNFGQHYAITAGLEKATGEWVVVMDCDLQDQPEEIINLYNKAIEGYDIVLARRKERKDNFLKKMGSKLFYNLFSYLTDTKQDYTVANFGIYKKEVIKSINTMHDYFRVFPILVQWVGFKRSYLDVEHASRFEGKSTYTNIKLFRLAFDMIISFSDKPLRLGMKFGIAVSVLSVCISVYYLTLYYLGIILVPGFTSLLLLIAFFSGIIIAFLGLLGAYIGKISLQVKDRPKFIIKSELN